MNKYLCIIKNYFEKFKDMYGLLGCSAVAIVMAKFIVFYSLMSTEANFIVVCLISFAITYLLFFSFKNKYIPAIIYLAFSILMFADVTYASFFNKYLSFGMVGAFSMLSDVTESIKAIMKPINFFMLIDAFFVFITVFWVERKQKINSKPTEMLAKIDLMENEENEDDEENGENEDDVDYVENEDDVEKEENEDYVENEEANKSLYASIITYFKGKKRKKIIEIIKFFLKGKKQILPFVIIFTLVISSSIFPFVKSITNQEFYTYHVKDLMKTVFKLTEKKYILGFNDYYKTEKEGKLFGIAEGKNLVVIQIESFQNFLIGLEYNGQEITPVLNSLLKDNTIYFDNYYQQVGTGNTSDAEYATNNSLMGSIEAFTYQIYEKNYFRGLPILLKEKGYETAVLHAHENRDFWNRDDIYENMGFDHYYGGLIGNEKGNFNMTEWMGWGLTDSEFYPQAVDYIKELSEPFYSFVISLSNHHPYEMLDKYQFIDLLPEDKDTIAGNYLNSAAYTDYALGKLIDEFKKAGLYEDTIFAFYGDHMGLIQGQETNKIMNKVLGHEYDWDDIMNIPLIIHIPTADKSITQVCHNAGGQIDFLPTIAYLMGFENLDTIYLGHNLLNYEDGVVAEHTYMVYGSFFTKNLGFEMSRDGVFENSKAWNLETRESVNVEDCYEKYIYSMGISDTSIYILQNDVMRKVYQYGMDINKAFGI